MIGTVISPIENAILPVHKLTKITKDDKQIMDGHDITYESKSVYHYKVFKYE